MGQRFGKGLAEKLTQFIFFIETIHLALIKLVSIVFIVFLAGGRIESDFNSKLLKIIHVA